MENRRCFIFGAAEINTKPVMPEKEDFIIAADGGLFNCKKFGIEPDMLIGDFDSLDEKDSIADTLRLPQIKDDTDTLAAIKFGLKKGFTRFLIYGGTGGRIDHTIANIQSLVFITENGGRGWLYDNGNIVTAIKNSFVYFNNQYRGYVSVFAANGTAYGINETGLKFTLTNADVAESFPVGVSNEFTGNESRISVHKGTLLIIYPDFGEQI